MNLEAFETGLASVIGQPSPLRPFVCEGSPLECQVFIVGYNPATAMDGDWWRFWQKGYGYRKSEWKNEYLSQRDGKASKTRSRIETIAAELDGVKIVEANIDARPSKRKSEYPTPVTAPFDYVLKACKPLVIIAHGVDAVAHIQALSPGCKLIQSKHFIYVGRERTAEIVAETKAALVAEI